MTTEQVITAFLAGRTASNSRISTDGTNCYSYSTLIAFKDGVSVYVTTHDYSATTTRQIRELWSRLESRETTIQRPVNVAVDNRGWTHADDQPSTSLFGRTPRKGSVGYRPIDELDGGHVATFTRAVPRAV
jgi:hypothetical protein